MLGYIIIVARTLTNADQGRSIGGGNTMTESQPVAIQRASVRQYEVVYTRAQTDHIDLRTRHAQRVDSAENARAGLVVSEQQHTH